ncbi:MAG: hypothetical protein ABMB14_13805 [Myxococcota bacterium]
MRDRPSYLDVDTRIAAGDRQGLAPLRGDPEWDAHLAATAPLDEVPAWVLELDRPRPRRRAWWWWPVLAAAVIVALLVVPRAPYVGVKGGPTALLYVQHGAERPSTVWDGAPLAAGDRFRVELADLEAPYFAIVYVVADEPPTVLATGTGDGLVDGAWALDAPAAGARLVVVGADRALTGLPADEVLARPAAVELRLR